MAVAGFRKLSQEQEQDVCARYVRGERSGLLAAAHGVNGWTIRATLERHGVPRIAQGATWTRYADPFSEDFFHCIDTPEKAYWLGFLHADGCISKTNQVRLSLSPPGDGPHVTCFLRSLGLRRGPSAHHYGRRSFFIGAVTSITMSADLRSLGVITGGRRWPQIDHDLEGAFCLGLFDGDGSWMLTRRNKDYIVASFLVAPDYAAAFSELVRRHTGISGVPKLYHPKISTVRYANQAQARTVAMWMYSSCNLYLPRKRKRVEHWVGTGEHECLR
jgi:hypothetical protein